MRQLRSYLCRARNIESLSSRRSGCVRLASTCSPTLRASPSQTNRVALVTKGVPYLIGLHCCRIAGLAQLRQLHADQAGRRARLCEDSYSIAENDRLSGAGTYFSLFSSALTCMWSISCEVGVFPGVTV